MINPSFNLKILNSFHDVFVKYSREIVKFLNDAEGSEQEDFVSVVWEQTFDAALGKGELLNIQIKLFSCSFIMVVKYYFHRKLNKRMTACDQGKIQCH